MEKIKKWLTEGGVWGKVCKCFGCELKITCSCCVVAVKRGDGFLKKRKKVVDSEKGSG